MFVPSKDTITFYIGLAIVSWVGWWYVVYFLTGFHLKSLRINNGLSFNGISFESKSVKVTLGSLRWRLWGNTRLVLFDDLEIYVKDRQGKKGASKKRQRETKDKLKIYPDNFVGRVIFRMIISHIPNVDIELRHSSITLSDKNTTRVDYLRFKLNSRYSVRYGDLIKFRPNLIVNNLVHTVLGKEMPIELFSVSSARFEKVTSIQISTGIITRIKLKLHIDETQISVFDCLKVLISRNVFADKSSSAPSSQFSASSSASSSVPSSASSSASSPASSSADDAPGKSKQDSDISEKFFDIQSRLYSVITDVSINFENVHAVRIPFASVSDNKPISVFFEGAAPKSVLKLDLKTISFNYSKLYKDDAGFEVLFDPKYDSPFHFSISGHLFKLFYVKTVEKSNNIKLEQSDEIINIPNYSLTLKTNILDHLARGKGFKNCVMEFFSSTSTPVYDFSTDQLSEMVYNFILLKKYFKLKKVKRALEAASRDANSEEFTNDDNMDDSDDYDETKVGIEFDKVKATGANTSAKDRIITLLSDYYPFLNVGLVTEQPRFIVRHYDRHHKKLQILNFSYSLLNFNLQTTDSRDYHASCNVLHPCINYHEKSGLSSVDYKNELFKSEILYVKSVVTHLQIFKNLKMQTDVDVNDPILDLSDLDILDGIHQLLDDITKKVETDLYVGVSNTYISSRIMAIQKLLHSVNEGFHSNDPLSSKMFKLLPPWLLGIQLSLNKVNIITGSRSILVPRKKLNSTEDEGLTSDSSGGNHKLRQLKLHLESVKFNLIGPQDNSDLPSSSPTVSSSSSTDTLTSVNSLYYWLADIDVNKFTISCHTDLNSKNTKFDPILKIPDITFKFQSKTIDKEDVLDVHGNIGNILLNYDKSKLFVILGALYVLQSFIVEPFKEIMVKLKSESNLNRRRSKEKEKEKSSLLNFVSLKLDISRISLLFKWNDSFRTKVEVFNTTLKKNVYDFEVESGNLRFLVDSSDFDGSWNRIICIDSPKVSLETPVSKNKLVFDSGSIRIIQPHQLVVHELFDNLSIHLKAAKHLIKVLKKKIPPEKVVNPSESKALRLPNIIIKSSLLSFKMEDDPFESELNMIYQLGLVEQRKRQELLSAFEDRQNQEEEISDEALDNLHREFSCSWIRKVRTYKERLRNEIHNNQKFQFGNEINIPRKNNGDLSKYSINPPLLSIIMENLSLDLSTTKFDLKEVPQFIHDFGQGVPTNSKYSLMVPTFMSLKLDEFRVHLRDYPLPVLYVPRNNDGSAAFFISGHMVIAESLILENEHIRELPFNFFPDLPNSSHDKYNSLLLKKSLSTVKFYTDLECQIHSKRPTRFVWGQSYQFGIQQVMLNFDQFSKPPVDPSDKLGFWDKLRLVLHGKMSISTANELEIGFKGSRDPYDLFDNASGFLLSFKDNVEWKMNENDDSKSFFNISSNKVSFLVPNYLSNPLVSWSAPSSEFTYLPTNGNMITSCYAYYLLDKTEKRPIHVLNHDICEKNVINLSGGISFNVGFLLQRKDDRGKRLDYSTPHYEVELWNPNYTHKGHDSYKGFRNDFIHMAISLFANSETSYNSIHLSPRVFEQFFKWWKLFSGNMQLPIRRGKIFGELKQSKKFSQHLFTNKFQFHFKSLFISHIYRDEHLETENDTVECVGLRAKMDDFLVDLHQRKEPRIETHEGLDRNKKIMKMNFSIGEVHLSGIDIRAVSAKFIQNVYTTRDEKSSRKPDSKYQIFDKDKRWFDINDFEEIFMPSLKYCNRKVSVQPLIHSEMFSYLRDTEAHASVEAQTFGKENIHDCRLYTKNMFEPQIRSYEKRLKQLQSQMNKGGSGLNRPLKKRIDFIKNEIMLCHQKWNRSKRKASLLSNERSAERFHNKFMLVNMFLKWNNESRNAVLRYIHFVQAKKDSIKCLSYESVNILNNIVGSSGESVDDSFSTAKSSNNRLTSGNFAEEFTSSNYTSEEAINKFDKILRTILDGQSITEDFLIEIVSPQIQLQSDEKSDSVVLVSAPNIDVKIISVFDESTDDLDVNGQELENRYGIMLKDANIFVLNKSDIVKTDQNIVIEDGYGSNSNWPPWLGIEICKNGHFAGKDKLLVEKMSMSIIYNQVKLMGSKLSHMNELGSAKDSDATFGLSNTGNNKLLVDVPKFVISSTSNQYFDLYVIVLSLLFYTEPMSKSLQEKLEKLKFSIDFENLDAIHERLYSLHKYQQMIKMLSKNYNFRNEHIGNEDLNDFLLLNHEREEVESEICLLIRSIINGDVYQNDQRKSQAQWFIRADQVILHMLEDDRTPILDIALAKGIYTRNINEDGSNNNRIQVGMMQGFNLIPQATYQSFIEPLNAPDESSSEQKLASIEWTMSRTVGGIKVMENFEVDSQPLNIKIDEITGKKLMNYIFLAKDKDSADKSLLDIFNKERQSNSDGNDINDDDDENEIDIDPHLKVGSGAPDNDSFAKQSMIKTSKLSSKSFPSEDSSSKENEENIDEMISRSRNYMSIVAFKFLPVSIMISIKMTKGYKRLLNVQDLLIHLPELSVQNEFLSFLDLSMVMKKSIIKVLMKHSGTLLKNKMRVKKNRSKKLINKPLKPLKKYVKFTQVSELRSESQSIV